MKKKVIDSFQKSIDKSHDLLHHAETNYPLMVNYFETNAKQKPQPSEGYPYAKVTSHPLELPL